MNYTKIDPQSKERVLAISREDLDVNEEDNIEVFIYTRAYLKHLGSEKIDCAEPSDPYEWWEIKCLLHDMVIEVQPAPYNGSLLVWLIEGQPHEALDLYSFFSEFLKSYRAVWKKRPSLQAPF